MLALTARQRRSRIACLLMQSENAMAGGFHGVRRVDRIARKPLRAADQFTVNKDNYEENIRRRSMVKASGVRAGCLAIFLEDGRHGLRRSVAR